MRAHCACIHLALNDPEEAGAEAARVVNRASSVKQSQARLVAAELVLARLELSAGDENAARARLLRAQTQMNAPASLDITLRRNWDHLANRLAVR